MAAEDPQARDALLARLRELEQRLAESEETLEAIRRGDIDALVVSGASAEHRIYTLESADTPYRVLIEQMQEGAVTLGMDGLVLYCNRRFAEMLDMPQERLIGRSVQEFLRPIHPGDVDEVLARAGQGVVREEMTLRRAGGADLPVHMSVSPLRQDGGGELLCAVLSDLTQQKQHVQALSDANARLLDEIRQREAVEDALRQSQKMEAVGQLTGGLAHDFNNLLTGIVGSLHLMRTRIGQGRVGELERYISASISSADRAAALTHRLLAFSRRQTLDPKLVDANQLVAGVEDLIERTVGPTVQVVTRLEVQVGTIRCDPNQLENALLNLAINARDAMPDGGRLTIETSDFYIEPAFAAARDMAPGRYVTISVTDEGIGMPPEVVARAFDPFFTTKPLGVGTGLGLSMIYGFVKQSGGQVRIHSKPGLGTTVRIYLPRHETAPDQDAAKEMPAELPRAERGETVMVVDDEAVVRMLVMDVLEDLGYAAVEAADGASGLRALDAAGRIDLLVTDVGLPGGMNGRQMADAARVRRPGLKVLFITGFAESAAFGNGEMEEGMEVMTKPFDIDDLAARMQAMIRK